MTKELQTQNFSGQNHSDMILNEQSREIAQVQAQFIVAKKFPRDESLVFEKVIKQCQRKSMAEVAMYSYPKGGSNVTGASIRLAELLANSYGNLEYGIRVLNQANDFVEAMAFCTDLENNTRKTDYFSVKLERYTKKGTSKLTDPRDIYEHTASQGARRVRGCILAIIPGDIVEAAIDQCEKTLNSDKEPMEVKIQKLVDAFATYNVSVEMIEKRIGKNLKALNNTDILSLRKVYQSLKDGMSGVEDHFEVTIKPAEGDANLPNAKKPKVVTQSQGEITEEEKAAIEKKESEEVNNAN